MSLDAGRAEKRLVLAGQRARAVATRLCMVMSAATISTIAATTVTATVFEPHQRGPYMLALMLSAATYGLIGMLVGPAFGRVAGAYMG